LFQFGMRHGMRAWATGQAWWQGDEGPYWGHNAVIRIAPFRAHARLETLPDGSHILSHDQVEATRLHAAGWKVRVLPDDTGSSEGNPPSYGDFITRDLRWAAGNMQYLALLRLPGLTPMARWQLIQAILLFLSAPFYVAILLFAAWNGLAGGADNTPISALLALLVAGWCCHYAAKLAGYVEVLLKPDLAARYGGRVQFMRGALSELVFCLHGTRAADEPMPVSAGDALWHEDGLGATKSQRTWHWICRCTQTILGADAGGDCADTGFCVCVLHRATDRGTGADQPAWRHSLCDADGECAVFRLAGQAADLRAA
jgi:hypothetical protein